MYEGAYLTGLELASKVAQNGVVGTVATFVDAVDCALLSGHGVGRALAVHEVRRKGCVAVLQTPRPVSEGV